MKGRKRGLFPALFCLILALLLTGCGGAGKAEQANEKCTEAFSEEKARANDMELAACSERTEDAGIGGGTPFQQLPDPSAKMVYTANLEMQTLEYAKTRDQIVAMVSEAGGFIQSQTESSDDYDWYYRESDEISRACSSVFLVARIPAERFDKFLTGLGEIGHVISKNLNAENISQTYYDTEATVSALTIERDRLLEMMDGAETIADMIEVESRLSEVERLLSGYKTDLASMDKSVNFSTVEIRLAEVKKYTEPKPDTFIQRLGQSIRRAGSGFVRFLQDLLIFLIYAAPYLLLLAAVIAFIVWLVRRFAHNHPARIAKREEKRRKKQAERAEKKAKKRERKARPEPDKNEEKES